MPRPSSIFSAAQVRALDAHEIEQRQVPSFALMTRAAEAAWRMLGARWPQARRLVVVCGGGNNGGDGYVLARLAQAAQREVLVLAATTAEQLRGDARRAHDEFQAAGGVSLPLNDDRAPSALASADVIVDALLGIGFQAPLRAPTLAAIRAINAARRPVLALDLPSGLDADRGRVHEEAVRADLTVCFVALKSGLFFGAGPDYAGEVVLEDLGIVPPPTPDFAPLLQRLDSQALPQELPRRARDSHKGTHGRVLIIGGGLGMPGALRLAGEAALRAGAGLVTVAGAPENLHSVLATRPELIYLPLESPADLVDALRSASVVAVGPGLGQGAWARALWQEVSRLTDKPVVADADALNLLAAEPRKLTGHWILTPHPGEAARLLGVDTTTVQADRLAAVRALQSQSGATVVLKGASTLVAGGAHDSVAVWLCDRGNAGMATAGMGDVLTGVIAGLWAQGGDSVRAASLGVLVHALAGDAAARQGQRGLLASDVLAELREVVNPGLHP